MRRLPFRRARRRAGARPPSWRASWRSPDGVDRGEVATVRERRRVGYLAFRDFSGAAERGHGQGHGGDVVEPFARRNDDQAARGQGGHGGRRLHGAAVDDHVSGAGGGDIFLGQVRYLNVLPRGRGRQGPRRSQAVSDPVPPGSMISTKPMRASSNARKSATMTLPIPIKF